MAAAKKGGGAASACGSPVQRMPRIPRVVAARLIRARVASRGTQAGDEASVRLGLGAARWNGPRVQRCGRAEWPAEQRAARGGRRRGGKS
jgi:hypothetical protein